MTGYKGRLFEVNNVCSVSINFKDSYDYIDYMIYLSNRFFNKAEKLKMGEFIAFQADIENYYKCNCYVYTSKGANVLIKDYYQIFDERTDIKSVGLEAPNDFVKDDRFIYLISGASPNTEEAEISYELKDRLKHLLIILKASIRFIAVSDGGFAKGFFIISLPKARTFRLSTLLSQIFPKSDIHTLNKDDDTDHFEGYSRDFFVSRMGNVLGPIIFQTGEKKYTEYQPDYHQTPTMNCSYDVYDDELDDNLDDELSLNDLIGLENVKNHVKKIVASAKMNKDLMEKKKKNSSIVLNMAFVGNPGTAKTTVARILTNILYRSGIVQTGKLIEVGRADLVGEFCGHTAVKVTEVFKKAKNGVLFIDEAYSLLDDKKGNFGDEAINAIVQHMENNRNNTIVIFAGYPEEMEDFLSRNPGLRSRVPFMITFSDYSVDEMVEIIKKDIVRRGFEMDEGALENARILCDIARLSGESGNGRFCRNLVDNALLNYASRIYGDCADEVESDFVLREQDFTELSNVKEEKQKPTFGFCAN